MRKLYANKGRWRFQTKSGAFYRDPLPWIEQRFLKWKEAHPRSRERPRTQHEIVNPVGENLGRIDDSIPDQDEEYESDDGFVVSDEYVEEEEENHDSGEESGEYEEGLSTMSKEIVSNSQQDIPTHMVKETTNSTSDYSDDDVIPYSVRKRPTRKARTLYEDDS